MRHKKTIFKVSSTALVLSIVFTALVPATATFAAEKDSTLSVTSNINFDSNSNFNLDRNELYKFGLSDSEIDELTYFGSTGITLKNGIAYDANGNIIENVERGKWSWAAKKLIANYNSLPGPIKAVISYGTMNAVAKKLEELNGDLEYCLTVALELVGFSPSVASWLAQGIAYALF
ncbi:hypothetical protein COE50_27555 [Bacillus anthracis]|nr:hypothetical protein COE50_27555 [Bacillus anthracis]